MPVLLKDYKKAGISAIKVLLNLSLLALECYGFNNSTCDFFFPEGLEKNHAHLKKSRRVSNSHFYCKI